MRVAELSATHYCLCTSVADISATLYCLCTSVADCILNKICFFCNACIFVAEIICNACCVAVFHHIVGISLYTATAFALQISAMLHWLALQKICNPVFCIANLATQSALQIVSATHHADIHFFCSATRNRDIWVSPVPWGQVNQIIELLKLLHLKNLKTGN